MSELSSAIKAVCEEKDLSYDSVVETIELSLAAAYRKDYGQKNQNIKVEFNSETGETKIMDVKTVVEDLPEDFEEKRKSLIENGGKMADKSSVADLSAEALAKEEAMEDKSSVAEAMEDKEERKFNPKTEIQIVDAKATKKDVKIGEEIVTEFPAPDGYGRMAAQTAKQVIIQKLREAEREMIYKEFKSKENEVVTGVVQRFEGRNVLVDLGKAIGRLSVEEQIVSEKYNIGDKIKILIKEIRTGSKGPEIVLSRIADEILKKVFYLEIPEIANGLLEIKAVAREAGLRSKVAIWTEAENVDPIGSCVGQRGSRIQTIISELGGERVDMVEYNEDPARFIANALSPAKIVSVDIISEEEKKAVVNVLADQLSLAIGKRGQNVRLAAKLTGWKIDIVEDGADISAEKEEVEEEIKEDEKVEADKKEDKEEKKSEKKVKKEKTEKGEKKSKKEGK